MSDLESVLRPTILGLGCISPYSSILSQSKVYARELTETYQVGTLSSLKVGHDESRPESDFQFGHTIPSIR